MNPPGGDVTDKPYTPIDASRPIYSGPELLLVQDYLPADAREKLLTYASAGAAMPAPVGDPRGDGHVGNRQDPAFSAERIDIVPGSETYRLADSICRDIYTRIVGPYYKTEIAWFEVPHMLRYRPGGHYVAHSDSENWDESGQCWVKGVDRDFSSVLYLNDDFTGGTLAFPYLNLRIHPRPGMLVTFPSNHRYLHAAEETLSGQRYAFVTWAAARNSQRVMNGTPPYIVRL